MVVGAQEAGRGRDGRIADGERGGARGEGLVLLDQWRGLVGGFVMIVVVVTRAVVAAGSTGYLLAPHLGVRWGHRSLYRCADYLSSL